MRINRRTLATGVTAAAALPAVRAFAQSTPAATPVQPDVEKRLLARMDEMGVPGAVFAIITPGSPEAVYRELGVANLETGEPISVDMHFRIASVTKTYVATVILQLVDEGKVALDDTIATLLPDLPVANADVATVRNLLSMRSGLPALTDSPEYVSVFLADPTQAVEFADFATLLVDVPAHADPDTEFEYNNFNYDILGEVIRVLTGESWDANVQQRILDPLGLSNTMMRSDSEMPQPYARGYGYLDQELPGATPEASPAPEMATPVASPVAGDQPVNDAGAYDLTAFNPTIAGAAGGLISTVKDQLAWVQALASGELISPEMHAEQIAAVPMATGESIGYGLGILDLGGIYGHNGAINGYQSAVVSSPELGIHIAVLTNAHPTIGFGDAAFTLVAELIS